MPARLPISVVADIKHALDEPGPLPFDYIEQIAEMHSTSVQTVYKIKKRLSMGLKAMPYSRGPVLVLRLEHEKALKLLLDKRPWMYLDELKTFLSEAYGIEVSISTVSRAIRRIQITRKRLKYVAA